MMKNLLFPWLFIAVLCFCSVGCKTHDAKFYAIRADKEIKNEDYPQAQADLSQAIALSPPTADSLWELYYLRGSVERNLFQFDAAIADFAHAHTLKPELPFLLSERAFTSFQRGDNQKALQDLEEASRHASESQDISHILSTRGFIRLSLKNYPGAEQDFNDSLTLDAENDMGFLDRGILRTILGNANGAIADYKKGTGLGKNPNTSDYCYLMLWIERAKMGQEEAATDALSHQMIDSWSDDSWSQAVAEFLVGQLNENDFLKKAATGPDYKHLGQACESWYYSGIKRLLAGDREGAETDFRNCIATKRWDYTEYHLAVGELDQISQPAPVAPLLPTTNSIVPPILIKPSSTTKPKH